MSDVIYEPGILKDIFRIGSQLLNGIGYSLRKMQGF